MDFDPHLKGAALRLAIAVHRFAASKGWPTSAYRVFMDFNPSWDHFYVRLFTDAVDPGANRDAVEIMRFMGEDLRDEPELSEAFGITIWPFDDARASWNPREGTIAIDDSLINPGVEDLRGNVGKYEEELRKVTAR